ncbi:hypothetical protein [Spongiactinospora sp. 9N601]|uniref:hypothetical protein n=1 Tax=Spongiactinospora sp. 9N601 TaxID=3375149 RepID=UPI0037ACC6C3
MKAAELMTGVRAPLSRGGFDLSPSLGLGSGSCTLYQRDGERVTVMRIVLSTGGLRKRVEDQLAQGARRLPEIVPESVGYYFQPANTEENEAYAVLVRGEAELSIQLEIGAPGRDNAADVLAMMKLIAPKLITDDSAPTPDKG